MLKYEKIDTIDDYIRAKVHNAIYCENFHSNRILVKNYETNRFMEYRVIRDFNVPEDNLGYQLWFIDGCFAMVVDAFEGEITDTTVKIRANEQFFMTISEYLRIHTECKIYL